jgi:thiol-disulfide isomerase/thioredoxin
MSTKQKLILIGVVVLVVWGGLTLKDRMAGNVVLAEKFDPALPTIMELGASWCPPCKATKSVLKNLQDNYAGFNVKYVDVEQNAEMARRYQVSSIPVIVFMDAGGATLFSEVGYMSKGDVLAKWKELGVSVSENTGK